MAGKMVWLKWWPSAWADEPSLKLVSRAARSLWVDMLCYMATHSPERGRLLLPNSTTPTDKQMTQLFADPGEDIADLIAELKEQKVCDVGEHGEIICRRMVRDEEKRLARERAREAKIKSRTELELPQDANLDLFTPQADPKPEKSSPESDIVEDYVQTSDVTLAAQSKQVGASDVHRVYVHYRSYHPRSHPRPKTNSKEWRAIAARLKEGYSVADICRAIDGCHKSSWHQGYNDAGKRYDSLELICRDASKINSFIEIAENGERNTSAMKPENAKDFGSLTEWVNSEAYQNSILSTI